jgi:hypothetical protein
MKVEFTNEQPVIQHVIVLFQGEWFNRDRALIRLVIDGAFQSGPGSHAAPMSADSGNDQGSVIDQTNGFNFISSRVTPGPHVAQIYWRSNGGRPICVDERSLIVEHA